VMPDDLSLQSRVARLESRLVTARRRLKCARLDGCWGDVEAVERSLTEVLMSDGEWCEGVAEAD
jgi:hypothetical protein